MGSIHSNESLGNECINEPLVKVEFEIDVEKMHENFGKTFYLPTPFPILFATPTLDLSRLIREIWPIFPLDLENLPTLAPTME